MSSYSDAQEVLTGYKLSLKFSAGKVGKTADKMVLKVVPTYQKKIL